MSLYCPILMYHQVGQPLAGEKPRNVVPPDVFRAQIAFLADRGCRAVSPDALWSAIRGGPGADWPARPVLISFDDLDARRIGPALEVLEAHGLPAAGYLIASRSGEFPSRALAGEMRAAGFTLGSHALSHAPLTGLSDAEARREVFESRRLIEERLGGPVEHFSYPHGAFGPREEELCREAGYRTALSTRRANRHRPGDLLRLARLAVRPYTSEKRLARCLGRAWHIQHALKERLGLERRGGR